MTNVISGEGKFGHRNELIKAADRLLHNEYRTRRLEVNVRDGNSSLVRPSELRTLRPGFPELSRSALDLAMALPSREHQGIAMRGLLRALSLLTQGSASSIPTVSDPFMYYGAHTEAIQKHGQKGQTRLHIEQVAYEGTITVDNRKYVFFPDQQILTTSCRRFDEEGRPGAGVTYTYLPHREALPTAEYSPHNPDSLPLINPRQSDAANMLHLLNMASYMRSAAQ